MPTIAPSLTAGGSLVCNFIAIDCQLQAHFIAIDCHYRLHYCN
jgi:hypothetical protein